MSGPLFTYTPNVPQASQYIRVTQNPILNNFQAINELINVNHVGFSDTINYGKHNYTSLISQGSNPSTSSNEMVLFCGPSTGPNPYEIFYRYPNNGSIVQLTGGLAVGGASNPGFAYLSPTVFMVWGNKTGIVNGSNTITFPTGGGFPVFTQTPFCIQYTPSSNYTVVSGVTYISSSSTTQFTFQNNASSFATSIYWFAIGA